MGKAPDLRFSDRADGYARHRPGYPPALLDLLRAECGLSPAHRVADIGAGTGQLARLFLDNGNAVWAVEPDPAMRALAERGLAGFLNFYAVSGSAEATTLADGGVDFWAAGQAFHWFDAVRARAEAARVLRPGGWAVLVWNVRQTGGSPFAGAYERFLRNSAPGYKGDSGGNVSGGAAARAAFFGPDGCAFRALPSGQIFDAEGLRGRFLSSSYAPAASDPDRGRILAALDAVFETHQAEGRVAFAYDTQVFYGRIAKNGGRRHDPHD